MAWADRDRSRAVTIATYALCCALLLDTQAQAQSVLSSEALRDACTRPVEAWVSFCNGYAQAAVDFAEMADLACLPEEITRTEIVTEIDRLTFDRIANGEIPKDTAALTVVVSVLETLYPCDTDDEASE